uniref:Uncharacterized protein n=1 Tax=Aegilops tauschii subsp. strangulata TaxID=200361 RepID=A0A453Q085_AEGTS
VPASSARRGEARRRASPLLRLRGGRLRRGSPRSRLGPAPRPRAAPGRLGLPPPRLRRRRLPLSALRRGLRLHRPPPFPLPLAAPRPLPSRPPRLRLRLLRLGRPSSSSSSSSSGLLRPRPRALGPAAPRRSRLRLELVHPGGVGDGVVVPADVRDVLHVRRRPDLDLRLLGVCNYPHMYRRPLRRPFILTGSTGGWPPAAPCEESTT